MRNRNRGNGRRWGMKKPAPGHRALVLIQELVALVRDRTSIRMVVSGNPALSRIMERAEEVERDATHGVPAYEPKPKAADRDRIGFCEWCGGYHAELVEVRP